MPLPGALLLPAAVLTHPSAEDRDVPARCHALTGITIKRSFVYFHIDVPVPSK